MTTPEGKVKAKLRKLLNEYTGLYAYWPVPTGYGRTTLDMLGCYRGRFFSVETKAEGKKPTLKQTLDLQTIERAMGRAFVIAGMDSPEFGDLKTWLDELTDTIDDNPCISPDRTNRRAVRPTGGGSLP
jgi:hypothetical protein